jgi:24-methylenesterol C-methyltransferase
MSTTAFDNLLNSLRDGGNKAADAVRDNKEIAVGVGAAVAVLGAWRAYSSGSGKYRRKPGAFELSGGSIDRKKIDHTFKDYSASYGKEAGAGITDRQRTTELVNTFYNLVTDIYEWGWGTSFHFSPLLPGKSIPASEAAHEARIAALLGLKRGQRALDVGCGVGGPMRTIAATSGAKVTGLTINDYQVSRAKYHNEKLGLAELCEPVEGNFLQIPFEAATFDGAYAIEATCHAAKLEEVYGEVYRVLKPGSYFASYEWVATEKFDPTNQEHVRIMDEINFGNGLPEMRTYTECEGAGKNVGFELVESRDLAVASDPCGPWYNRLKYGMSGRSMQKINHAVVSIVSFLHIAPKGVKEVHDMLVRVANSLVDGGETGVFSPMHLLLFRKPLEDEGGNGKADATAAASDTANGAKPAAKKAAGKAKQ